MDHHPALAIARFHQDPAPTRPEFGEVSDKPKRNELLAILAAEELHRASAKILAFDEIILACRLGSLEAVAWMLRAGSYDPRYRSSARNKTLLMFAAEIGHADLVDFLAPMSDPAAVNGYGHSALILAASRGHAQCCARLVAYEGQPACDPDGMTPLMFAAQMGRASCIPLLASHCDIHARDVHDRDALHLACEASQLDVARLLLDLSAGPSLSSVQNSLRLLSATSLIFPQRTDLLSILTIRELSMREREELTLASLDARPSPAATSRRI